MSKDVTAEPAQTGSSMLGMKSHNMNVNKEKSDAKPKKTSPEPKDKVPGLSIVLYFQNIL